MAEGGKLVECVPNFSEGRRKEVIDAIAEAIRGSHDCSLLDVDPGASTNRTVFTFVGPPTAVLNGAANAARAAFPLIDMRKHKGSLEGFHVGCIGRSSKCILALITKLYRLKFKVHS